MNAAAKLISVIVAVSTLAACNASVDVGVGTKTLDKDALQSEVQSQLTKTVGEEAPPITCPGDLDAEVGESITCTLTDDTGTYDVVVTVNSIENGTADLDIQVADAPNP